jgi:hypothetical protein
MGRKKLNRTVEELRKLQRARSKRHYARHRDELNAKSMKRYWEKKERETLID